MSFRSGFVCLNFHAAVAFRANLAVIRAQQGAIGLAKSLISSGESLVAVYPLERGKLLCKKAQVHLLAGEQEQAETALKQAQHIAQKLNVKPDSELGTALQELVTLFHSKPSPQPTEEAAKTPQDTSPGNTTTALQRALDTFDEWDG